MRMGEKKYLKSNSSVYFIENEKNAPLYIRASGGEVIVGQLRTVFQDDDPSDLRYIFYVYFDYRTETLDRDSYEKYKDRIESDSFFIPIGFDVSAVIRPYQNKKKHVGEKIIGEANFFGEDYILSFAGYNPLEEDDEKSIYNPSLLAEKEVLYRTTSEIEENNISLTRYTEKYNAFKEEFVPFEEIKWHSRKGVDYTLDNIQSDLIEEYIIRFNPYLASSGESLGQYEKIEFSETGQKKEVYAYNPNEKSLLDKTRSRLLRITSFYKSGNLYKEAFFDKNEALFLTKFYADDTQKNLVSCASYHEIKDREENDQSFYRGSLKESLDFYADGKKKCHQFFKQDSVQAENLPKEDLLVGEDLYYTNEENTLRSIMRVLGNDNRRSFTLYAQSGQAEKILFKNHKGKTINIYHLTPSKASRKWLGINKGRVRYLNKDEKENLRIEALIESFREKTFATEINQLMDSTTQHESVLLDVNDLGYTQNLKTYITKIEKQILSPKKNVEVIHHKEGIEILFYKGKILTQKTVLYPQENDVEMIKLRRITTYNAYSFPEVIEDFHDNFLNARAAVEQIDAVTGITRRFVSYYENGKLQKLALRNKENREIKRIHYHLDGRLSYLKEYDIQKNYERIFSFEGEQHFVSFDTADRKVKGVFDGFYDQSGKIISISVRNKGWVKKDFVLNFSDSPPEDKDILQKYYLASLMERQAIKVAKKESQSSLFRGEGLDKDGRLLIKKNGQIEGLKASEILRNIIQ
ncbi:MAG: hypothetical protein ACTSXQ_00285 [Alphaproteobacteria bacterium]